ncbi:hypothetical protein EUTSA_v10017643mg [Eutrema salsugineum]|uniref:poly(A)-specific ribonuclease n=1 Tax=Eutrema salsugineum TaxID=72664 RepID=V4M9D4_EUTSA|nr:carbon catabolite repressor protein 4 homolog 2 [Eutrema salsugineum]ESQ52964.1 hypothetical protein EUTSA_v10017643mg [Eutrema salsugineum]
MLSILGLEIPSEVPILDMELTPNVVVSLPNNTRSTADVPASAPVDGLYLRYKWYRVEGNKNATRCHLHPSEQATLQCNYCAQRQSLIAKSYHCSSKCFKDAWPFHKTAHEESKKSGIQDDVIKNNNNHGATGKETTLREVGHCRTYMPTPEDLDCVLKLEVSVVSAKTGTILGSRIVSTANRVVRYPTPFPRYLIAISGLHDAMRQPGNFTVLSYNILSDTSATSDRFSYCPPWARTWTYRRTNLLMEIFRYGADVVCLQEVQEGHLEDFLAPGLDKFGYDVQYKRRTNEVLSGRASTIDGCATFFKRDRFSFVRKYDIEFNKCAQALVEASVPDNQKALASERLIKDNIGLIVVLEPKFSIQQPAGPSAKHPLICVANTCIDIPEEMKDVMLWQVHTLLKGIARVAVSDKNMPMIMCGDFNMVPGSAAHSLVVMGSIHPQHPDLTVDPFGILQPQSQLVHDLPLVSAYSALSRLPIGPGWDKYRRSIHRDTNEPVFTICTKDFTGCHDYIFYTGNNLRVESLLELMDEMVVRKNTALPSTQWSSSHIAILAQFRCVL